MRLFENRVTKRKLGPKGVELTGEFIKLRNEELNLSEPCVLYIGRA